MNSYCVVGSGSGAVVAVSYCVGGGSSAVFAVSYCFVFFVLFVVVGVGVGVEGVGSGEGVIVVGVIWQCNFNCTNHSQRDCVYKQVPIDQNQLARERDSLNKSVRTN